MFHKHNAEGKKPFLWISVLEWGKKEFDLVATSRVLGEDESREFPL